MVIFFLFFLGFMSPGYAKDFGVRGHVYPIAEEDLLDVLLGKLRVLQGDGKLAEHQEILQKQAEASVKNPKPVPQVIKILKARTLNYDPSLTVPYDLKDNQGRVFQKKGTRVNPLSMKSLSRHLIFIQGEDGEEVQWAVNYLKTHPAKLILVSGSPWDLMNTLGHPVYFDQGGTLTQKLGIRQVPAVVRQEGLILKISELLLGEDGS